MKTSLFLLFLVNFSYAGFLDIPLRTIELNSTLSIANELLIHSSAPNTIYIQNAEVKYLGVDDKRPYCSLTKYMEFSDPSEFINFKLDSLSGAFVYDPKFSSSQFTTTIKLSTNNNFIEMKCFKQIQKSQKIEELNITDLANVFGNYLGLNNLQINGENYKSRFSPQITVDFVTHSLALKLKHELVLVKTVEDLLIFEANVGQCKFFSLGAPTTYEQNTTIIPKSFEVFYSKDHLIKQNPTIILRFDENNGVYCSGSSANRLFDYQDFWDASGKESIDWIIL